MDGTDFPPRRSAPRLVRKRSHWDRRNDSAYVESLFPNTHAVTVQVAQNAGVSTAQFGVLACLCIGVGLLIANTEAGDGFKSTLNLTVTIYPEGGNPIQADAVVDLKDLPPASAQTVPVSIRGKLLKLTPEQQQSLTVARQVCMTFDPNAVRYEAIIDDAGTGDFRAID